MAYIYVFTVHPVGRQGIMFLTCPSICEGVRVRRVCIPGIDILRPAYHQL